MNNPLLTASQVARLLGISVERVRQLARTGRLESTSTPLGRLYDPAVVERLRTERADLKHSEPTTSSPDGEEP
jgi:excisionase family DNA binding protein